MGIFGKIFGKKEMAPEVQAPAAVMQKVNLSKERFVVCLEKKGLSKLTARVVFVIDKSGSTDNLYADRTVQNLVERMLPVAVKFDDNAELDVYVFESGFSRMPSITEKSFHNYIDNVVMKKHPNWGGTKYAPVMEDIIERYAIQDKSDLPTFVIFITDGDNSDKDRTEEVIKQASKYNIFWQFVGIGNSRFDFLDMLDNMSGRTVDNAGFFKVPNPNKPSDDEFYDLLMTEFPKWIQAAKAKGILK